MSLIYENRIINVEEARKLLKDIILKNSGTNVYNALLKIGINSSNAIYNKGNITLDSFVKILDSIDYSVLVIPNTELAGTESNEFKSKFLTNKNSFLNTSANIANKEIVDGKLIITLNSKVKT